MSSPARPGSAPTWDQPGLPRQGVRAWTTTESPLHTVNPLRMQVAQRLATAGRRHARHADDQRWNGKPIAPHAVVFLYQDPPTARTGDGLHCASRLFLAGPDVAHLPTILTQLLERAMEYATGPRDFDPRRQMSTNVEPMHRAAKYVGLGVSTLDGMLAPAAAQSGGSALRYDTPFRVLGLLTDETKLVVSGAGMAAPLDIRATHTLDTGQSSGQRWRWMNTAWQTTDEQRLPEIWERLAALHDLIIDAADGGFVPHRTHEGPG
jgi:hypothetical protein